MTLSRGSVASSVYVEASFAAVNNVDGECGLDGAPACTAAMAVEIDDSVKIVNVNDTVMAIDIDSTPTSTIEYPSTITTVPFPKMPEKIRAILHEDWNILDPKGEEMISKLSTIDGAVEFAHASTTFYEHLKGTFGILAAWDQPEEVRRTGLVHTAYSGDLFQFFLFDANKEEERA